MLVPTGFEGAYICSIRKQIILPPVLFSRFSRNIWKWLLVKKFFITLLIQFSTLLFFTLTIYFMEFLPNRLRQGLADRAGEQRDPVVKRMSEPCFCLVSWQIFKQFLKVVQL